MRKIFFIFTIFTTIMLSGCSLLDEVNNSLDYVNEANSYINSLNEFAEDAPQLLQEAAENPDVKDELNNQVDTLITEIENFNNLDAPAIAEDIHQNIVTKNETLLEEINNVREDGQLMLDKFENSEILNTVNDVKALVDSIEKLEL